MTPLPNITGHIASQKIIESMFRSERVPHTLLFSGPEAVGKRSTAFELVAHCFPPEVRELIMRAQFPDLHVLEIDPGKKEISAQNARALIESLALKSYYGSKRFAIIDNAHRLSISAANALLKTLEEPPSNTHIILITSAAHRLPETIVSRCHTVHFGTLNDSEINLILSGLAETLQLSSEILPKLAGLCDGTLASLSIGQFRDEGQLLKRADLNEHLNHLAEMAVL